jgi:hypothetical protein
MVPGLDAGKIALYAFILIFCAIGVGLIYGAVVTYQGGETTNALLMLVAAFTFGGFGAGVFALARASFLSQARETQLRTAHPDEPWRWREDWASGRIHNTGKAAPWFFWGFAILWNLISTPILFFLPKEIIENENYAALLGLLFPLAGILLIGVAVQKTIQRTKFGNCLFLMDRVPGILGGEVTGTILFPHGLSTAETVTVRLSCIHRRQQRSGKETSTSEEAIWQAEQAVVRLSPSAEEAATRATVRFRVPFDTSPTGEIDENNSVFWKLEADASVPGVDLATDFEIPVFKTGASSPQITEERLRTEDLSTGRSAIGSPDQMGVSVVPSARGGSEFVIKARQGASGSVAAAIMVLIFGGIAVALAYAGAPFIFSLVFGIFALLIVFIVVFLAFGESRIVVEERHVSVRNSLFGIMMGKRIPCSSIAKIGVKGESQPGKRGYYSITLTREDGTSVSPFQFLQDRRQADWLAEEVRKAMEPWRGGKHS